MDLENPFLFSLAMGGIRNGKEWPKTEKPSRKLYPKRRGCQIYFLRKICLTVVVIVFVVAEIPYEVLNFLLVGSERNAGNLDFEGLKRLKSFGRKTNRLWLIYHRTFQRSIPE